jgi:hypothetical protein
LTECVSLTEQELIMREMKRKRWGYRVLTLGMLVCGAAVGCDDKNGQQAAAPAPAQPAEALPANLIVATPPAEAKEVVEARKANDGDEVVVRGRIGGSAKPFTEGRAVFQLVDLAMKTCNQASPMDDCKTPWDYCCDDKADVFAKSVTVQVLGPSGQPLRASLDGVGGLKPMGEVAVKGTVKKSPDGKAVTVNATELYVKQG